MAALLVQMTNPRCQMVHKEVDEVLEHRDAMNAHQSARNRCFGTALRPFLGPHRPLDNGGGVEVCTTEMLVEPSTAARDMSVVMHSTTIEAVTTRLGSQQAPADKQGHGGCAHQHTAARGRMDVSIDTTHFRLTSRRHGWEQVAECIRQERIVKRWMHFRAARAARDAREPYRRERAYCRSGSTPRGT